MGKMEKNTKSDGSNDDGRIFKWNQLTDFEKNLFLKAEIKELQEALKQSELKRGILQSEKDELIYLMKAEEPDKTKLIAYKQEIKSTREKLNQMKKSYSKLMTDFLELQREKL